MSASKSTAHAGQARLENGQRIVLSYAVVTGNPFLFVKQPWTFDFR